ncbi:MAG: DUF1549 domain-containing protein [Planctomycetota bacterium]|nr:DUF1549 domain-containing protein [Planctomycetota bacterium]
MNVPADPTPEPQTRPSRAAGWVRARSFREVLRLYLVAGVVAALVWGGVAGYRKVRLGMAERSLTRTIDARIEASLASEKAALAPEADDAHFLRRAYLDLTGAGPTVEAARAFLADRSGDKRERLINSLVDSRAYAHWLADQWDAYLFFGSGVLNEQIDTRPMAVWLEEQFAANRPWDKIATEILTATGKQHLDGRVTPYLSARKPEEAAALFGRAFMGVRLGCAQCHDHPYAPITHQDFWRTAAFFDKVNVHTGFEQFPNNEFMRAARAVPVGADVDVFESPAPPERKKPDRALDLEPRFLDGKAPRIGPRQERRQFLAAWLTAPGNPYFAKAMVNRIWWQVFGVGLVTPFDDQRETNAPSHPELLNELASAFVASGYDVRFLTRAICNTKLYRREGLFDAAPKGSAKSYAGVPVKVLNPKQVFESYCKVIGVESPYGAKTALPGKDIRWDSHVVREEFVRFFDTHGDPAPFAFKQGIPQLLRLMNEQELNAGIDRVAAAQVKAGATPRAVVEDFYLRVYARPPREDEMKLMLDFVARKPENAAEGYRGVLWALLNSTEFWIRS